MAADITTQWQEDDDNGTEVIADSNHDTVMTSGSGSVALNGGGATNVNKASSVPENPEPRREQPAVQNPRDNYVDPEMTGHRRTHFQQSPLPKFASTRAISNRRLSRMASKKTHMRPWTQCDAKKCSFKQKRQRRSSIAEIITGAAELAQDDTRLFCLSSCLVLAIRLYLDQSPTAYLIHSIIVFFDMILIHLFTHNVKLSIAGEITTIIFVIAFTLTGETLYELLETVTIAVLASFHLIGTRHEAKLREEELESGVENLRQQAAYLMNDPKHFRSNMGLIYRQSSMLLHDIDALEDMDEEEGNLNNSLRPRDISEDIPETVPEGDDTEDNEDDSEEDLEKESDNNTDSTLKNLQSWFLPANESGESKTNGHTCGDLFFEYFLDGAAGVMYTSFIGLIIDEIIQQVMDN